MRTLLLSVLSLCIAFDLSAQITASITASGPTTFCQGDSVFLVANPNADTYQWYLNGTAMSGANNDTLIVNAAGSYEVEIDSAGNVDISASEVVTVNTVPAQPGPITGNTSICSDANETYSVSPVPGATSYTWTKYSYPYSLTVNTTGPTFTGQVGPSANGNTPNAVLKVTANNSCGSSSYDSLSILTYTPVMLGGMNQNIDIADGGGAYCPIYSGQPCKLYANWHPQAGGYSTANSYQWYRNNVLIPGATGQWLTITKGGNYSVQIFCGPCPVTLVKNPLPQCLPRANIYPLGGVTMCVGSNVTLNVDIDADGYSGSSYSWQWVLNGTVIPGTSGVYSITPSSPGDYSVRLQGDPCSGMGGPVICNNPVFIPPSVSVTFSNNIAPAITVTQSGNVLSATPGFAAYQWYRNGVPIPNATNDTYTITVPGTHTVVAYDGSCTAMYKMGLGVETVQVADFDLSLYPNPNQGLLNVSANIPKENKQATIYVMDITGKIIISEAISVKNGIVEEQLQLNNRLIPGLYLLKLQSENFSKVVSFVKQ